MHTIWCFDVICDMHVWSSFAYFTMSHPNIIDIEKWYSSYSQFMFIQFWLLGFDTKSAQEYRNIPRKKTKKNDTPFLLRPPDLHSFASLQAPRWKNRWGFFSEAVERHRVLGFLVSFVSSLGTFFGSDQGIQLLNMSELPGREILVSRSKFSHFTWTLPAPHPRFPVVFWWNSSLFDLGWWGRATATSCKSLDVGHGGIAFRNCHSLCRGDNGISYGWEWLVLCAHISDRTEWILNFQILLLAYFHRHPLLSYFTNIMIATTTSTAIISHHFF